MRNRLTALTIAIAAVLALTGCGSSTTAAPAATTAAPAMAAVADVTGQNAKDAAAALKEAGFETKYDAGDQTVVKASNWTVDSTTPAAGENADKGSTVILHVSKPAASAAPAPSAAATTNGLTETYAQAACSQRIDGEFPYGADAHWIVGRIAHEIVNDKWFFKVETTVTNAANAKRDVTVECTVSGTNTAPTVDAFSSY